MNIIGPCFGRQIIQRDPLSVGFEIRLIGLRWIAGKGLDHHIGLFICRPHHCPVSLTLLPKGADGLFQDCVPKPVG